jgi:type II secretion system protein H
MSTDELMIDDCLLIIGRKSNRQSSFVHRQSHEGFTLVEMLLVVALVGLMTGVAMLSLSSLWGNLRFKRQAGDLVNMIQMAQEAASSGNRRYQVALNRDSNVQAYLCREYTEEILAYDNDIFENAGHGYYDDSMIEMREFNTDSIYLDRVEFDYYTEADLANNLDDVNVYHFIAGRAGWQCGGKIVLLDAEGNPWTILVHRFAKPVELVEGDVDMLVPLYPEQVPF